MSGDPQKDLKTLHSFVFQMNEEMRYLLHNLDVTNFNDLGLARYENGRLQIYSEKLEIKAQELTAEFEASDEQLKTTLEASVSGLRTEVEEEIEGLGTWVSEVEQTANSISLVVSNGSINAAAIVTAINNAGSSVKISADHVNITGLVTVSDLAGEGTVEINAGNIKAGGTIEGVYFRTSGNSKEPITIGNNLMLLGTAGSLYSSGDAAWMSANDRMIINAPICDFLLNSGMIRISDTGIHVLDLQGNLVGYVEIQHY